MLLQAPCPLASHRLARLGVCKCPPRIDIDDEWVIEKLDRCRTFFWLCGETTGKEEIPRIGRHGSKNVGFDGWSCSFTCQLLRQYCGSRYTINEVKRTWSMTAICSVVPHGRTPVHISTNTHPKLQISALPEYDLSLFAMTTSGAIQNGVPRMAVPATNESYALATCQFPNVRS